MINTHPDEQYSVRVRELDEKSGCYGYRSKHFYFKCCYLSQLFNRFGTDNITIDYNNLCIKQPSKVNAAESSSKNTVDDDKACDEKK